LQWLALLLLLYCFRCCTAATASSWRVAGDAAFLTPWGDGWVGHPAVGELMLMGSFNTLHPSA
jgi:hypothetical protein